MRLIGKIVFAGVILMGCQILVTDAEAAHRGGGVDNGRGPGLGGVGNGNGGNGNGAGASAGGGGGGGAAAGGAQGAPAPIMAASLFGQAIALGGGFIAWRRRKVRG